MLGAPRIQTCLRTIYERRKLARDVFLGVLFVSGMFAFWAWQYSASAIVRQAPSGSQEDHASAVDAASSALTDDRLAAIIQHLRLYSDTVRERGESSVVDYVRSRLSLQSVGRNENNNGLVRITYLSADKSTAIKVVNALAQSLIAVPPSASDSLSVDTAATIDRQLQDSRIELKQMAVKRRIARRRTSARQNKEKLSAPAQPTGQSGAQEHVASSAAPVSVPSPQAFAIKALQQQIKDADARLVELRQRYTDQYPDVQDTQEDLQELRSKLIRLQAESARSQRAASPSVEQPSAADQTLAQKELAMNAVSPETKHEKSSMPSTVGRAYGFELDRYHVLLRAQRNMQEYQDKGLGAPQPPFTLVQNATQARAAGFALSPLYWLMSLLVGLFASVLAVLFADRLKTLSQEKIAVRNQFERDELSPHYHTGTR